jgi:hypothetical protein
MTERELDRWAYYYEWAEVDGWIYEKEEEEEDDTEMETNRLSTSRS